MAYTYERENEEGYKIVVLPITIKRGGESSISISKIYVRNYSETTILSSQQELNFKLKNSYVFSDNDNINLNPGSVNLTTEFYPVENYMIPYDGSVNFNPIPEDFFLGIRGDIINDDQFLTFLLSYEPIKSNPQIGNHTAELVIEYLDGNNVFKSHYFFVSGSCVNTNAASVDGFSLNLISNIYGTGINSVIIN